MPSIKSPRSGSMQFWPRKKAKRIYPRIRSWLKSSKVAPIGFIGYKVGMMHVMASQENKNSHVKGEKIFVPVTIIECPPIKILSVRLYKQKNDSLFVENEIFLKADKELSRKIKMPKENSKELDSIKPEDYAKITITVYTHPGKAGFGKKKPEILEMNVGGSNSEIINYVKDHKDKEIEITDVFEENKMVDVHGVTKGKGYQGPVKRFGIGLKPHKSEKGRRAPGSLGPWVRQQHISWRVAHAGQKGFHQRIEYNKQILKISDDPKSIGSDFHKYGNIKSKYALLHGSIMGPSKRMIILSEARRKPDQKHKLALN